MIEKTSGETYPEFIRKNIFGPLGMIDSGYLSNSAVIPRRASGYYLAASGIERGAYHDASLLYSAGGLYSTTADLLRWERALFGGKLLTSESLKRMIAPFRNGFACGLMDSTVDGHPAIEHSGEMEGFASDMIYYSDDKLVVIVLNNLSGETKPIAAKLGAIAHDEKVVLPSERKIVRLPPEVLARYVGTYTNLAPDLDLQITLEDGHLVSQVVGKNGYKEQKHSLKPQTESTFFQKDFESEYTFSRNANGDVVSVVCVAAGRRMEAQKER